ncbi:MAG: DUF5615 family PIN-like protein [Anaerolineae bacterium]|nr:DUF5615 family PIN-like protein [Anaerolineae bacterium]
MKFWADENFHGVVLRGLLAKFPDLDILRIQDTEFYGAADEVLLEAAARQGIILLTRDVKTMTKHAYDRIRAGLPMPGVIEIVEGTSIAQAIDDLIVLIGAGKPEDFENQVRYVPMR